MEKKKKKSFIWRLIAFALIVFAIICRIRWKTWLLGLLVLSLLSLGTLCKIRWHVWFSNLPEIRYTLSDVPQRVLLTFGNEGERSRRVSWVCGGVSKQASLEYTEIGSQDTLRTPASSRFIRTLGGYSYANWAKFGTLSYGRSYAYRVWNDHRSSAWYTFTMQPDSTDHFSFVFIGDVQDTLHGKTRAFMENIRHHYPAVDFYMFVGDFAERPMNCYWEEAYRSVDSIAPSKPLLVSPGNHEYLKGLTRVLEKRFAYTFSYLLESRYKGNNVYALDYRDATLITLDSNRDPWFMFSQREWLEQTLQNSRKKWKIVMLHHPVYSIKGKMKNLPVRWMFDDLFRKYGVDLVLQGHEHNYARMTAKTPDGTMTTPLYLVSHASPKTYSLAFDQRYDRFGTNHRFYQLIDVVSDTLRLNTYLENDSLYDRVVLIKQPNRVEVKDEATHIPEQLEMPWLTGKKAKKYTQAVREWKASKQIK